MASITPSQAKEAAHNLGEKLIKINSKQSEEIKDLIKQINNTDL